MKIKKNYVEFYLSVILGVGVGCLRPAAIGEIYSLYIALFLTGLLIVYRFIFQLSKKSATNNDIKLQCGLIFTLVSYLLFRAALTDPDTTFDRIKMLILTSIVILIVINITRDKRHSLFFFDSFAILIFFSCASVTISFALLAFGFSYDFLHIADLEYTYESHGDFLFPCSLAFNYIDTLIGPVPRLSGLYREPGVLPIFASWFSAYAYWRGWPMIYVIIAIVGSILSLSSMGPLSLFTGAMLILSKLGFRPRISLLTLFLFAILFWPAIYSIEYVGLEAKVNSGSESFDERYNQFFEFLNIKNLIFGDGADWSQYTTSGINVIAASRSFGVVYLFLILFILSFNWKSEYLLCCGLMPAFIIIFSAQPVVLEPAFVVLCMSWYIFGFKEFCGRNNRPSTNNRLYFLKHRHL